MQKTKGVRTHTKRAMRVAKKETVVGARTFRSKGISSVALSRLVREGKLVRTARGLYTATDADVTEHYTLVEVAQRLPKSVICLLSALHFYDLTTELPHKVWVAFERGKARPQVPDLPVHLVSFSSDSFSYGVDFHTISGVEVRVTSPAKTVADCFKFRNKIGLDIALEALRDYRRKGLGTREELWEAAKICRVANVMRPYMEAI